MSTRTVNYPLTYETVVDHFGSLWQWFNAGVLLFLAFSVWSEACMWTLLYSKWLTLAIASVCDAVPMMARVWAIVVKLHVMLVLIQWWWSTSACLKCLSDDLPPLGSPMLEVIAILWAHWNEHRDESYFCNSPALWVVSYFAQVLAVWGVLDYIIMMKGYHEGFSIDQLIQFSGPPCFCYTMACNHFNGCNWSWLAGACLDEILLAREISLRLPLQGSKLGERFTGWVG